MPEITVQTKAIVSLWNQNNLIVKSLDATLGAIHGIGFSEYMVLHQLVNSPHNMLRRVDLANLLGRSASGITKMLNPMEKIGLVSREKNLRDARVSLVKVTKAGIQSYQQTCETINQTTLKFFNGMNPTETADLDKLLNAMST